MEEEDIDCIISYNRRVDEGDFEESATRNLSKADIAISANRSTPPNVKVETIEEIDADEVGKKSSKIASPIKNLSFPVKIEQTKPPEDTESMMEKMRVQNSKLKKEFTDLKEKLKECLSKVKAKKRSPITEKPEKTEDELAREQEIKDTEQRIQYYKKQIQMIKHQLETSFNIEKIVALENEEKAKRRLIEKLKDEEQSLAKMQRDPKHNIENEADFKKRKEQLKEELRNYKNELKEKQNLLRKQEKYMKDQHESFINLEERCRKLQTLVYERKAGIIPADDENAKTEEDVAKLREELKNTDKAYNEEKKKYKQLITGQETRIKDLSYELERLNLVLKQKDQESRMNSLKINELKRQLRTGAKAGTEGIGKAKKSEVNENLIAITVDQLKRDMMAEMHHRSESKGSASLIGETELVPKEVVEEKKKIDNIGANVIGKKEVIPKDPEYIIQPKEEKQEVNKPVSVFSKPNIGIGRKKK